MSRPRAKSLVQCAALRNCLGTDYLSDADTRQPDTVLRFWRVLGHADTLLKPFSANFYGKISPVHSF